MSNMHFISMTTIKIDYRNEGVLLFTLNMNYLYNYAF